MLRMLAAATAAFLVTAPALAQTVDGTREAAFYGAAKSTVLYNPTSASYDFGAPTPFAEATGYNIYLAATTSAVFGYLQSTTPGGTGAGSFANLYFDLNPSVGNGSDLGFEITNGRAFIPGVSGYSAGSNTSPLTGLSFALSPDGTGIEFSIANSLFNGPIAGLDYSGLGGPFPTIGSPITLRLSQSFNYTVAGGPTYGSNRLGSVALGAVPEPRTWAMLILGFGLVGAAMRRRSTAHATLRAA